MSQVKEVFRVIREFIRVLPVQAFFKPPKDDDKKSLGLVFQTTAARYPERTAIIFEERELSWRELNALVNRFAHLLKQQGVERGDTVALLMQNRIEMLAALLGGCKLGVTVGLINNSLTGKSLLHCIRSVQSKKCIVGEEVFPHIAEIRAELELEDKDFIWVRDIAQNDGQGQAPEWVFDASAVLANMPDNNPPETTEILAGEKAFYIFTSGTTGLPKAAVLYHRRYLSASEPYAKVGFSAKPTDRLYACLPLYHITGLGVGVGSCLVTGASMYLRRNFSASAFWPEVQKYQCNLFIYVGELCRYLAMQPECPEEKNNPIEKMMGNGLRPDIWDQFRHRFDVERICEIYGSSEGNASFINVLNKDYTIGASTAKLMLVKYDVDSDEMVRDEQGKLVEVEKGEPGLLLSKIEGRYLYDGYQDKKATNSKVLTDLQEAGDQWFNTGDMVKQIDVGFAMGLPHFQFVDRVGDTFRWRAENVSTNEVGEILCCHDQVAVANVYGVKVPGAEGKAGMVAITPEDPEQFDMVGFASYIEEQLPHYARPVFIRLQKEAETTVTFKLFKGRLRKEAYHLDQIDDPVYVLKPGANSYEQLDAEFYQQLVAGKAGY